MSILDVLKIKAAWYEPDAPDKQIFGTLDGENLETFQTTNFSQLAEIFNSQRMSNIIPVLYGVGQKTITLTNVLETHSESNLTNLRIVTYQYNDAILDIHYKQSDRIKTLSFAYPFIWGPFKNKKPEDEKHGSFYAINETINVTGSIKLKIGQHMGTSFSLLEQKTKQSEFFQIETEPGMELDEILTQLKSINHFLRLCMGKIVFPEYINGTTTNLESFKYYPYWLTRYHQNNKFKNPRITDEKIIGFYDLKDNFEEVIKKWNDMWFRTHEVMYDFFNIFETEMSLNTMFTEITHVLQRFYDAIETRRESFRNKITWFLGLCPEQIREEISKDNFVDKIVNTRNYNVHGNDVNEDYLVKDGVELNYLTKDLKSLTEIFLVSQLPIENKIPIMEKIYKLNNYARTHPVN